MTIESFHTLGQINRVSKTQASATTMTLDPPAKCPSAVSCRVTAGAAAAGPRVITDSGGTPDATAGQLAVATLSDDGATLTFEAAVTAAELVYESDAVTTGVG